MEKDIGKIVKNPDTDIVIRIDDFGGKVGLTIREFVKGERYTGFTKAGTRIPVDKFKEFKTMINAINEKELETLAATTSSAPAGSYAGKQSSISAPSSSSSSSSSSKPAVKGKAKPKAEEDIEDMAM